MKALRCLYCKEIVDTENDPDGFYVIGHEYEFICQWCRDDRNLQTIFDTPTGEAKYVE